MWICGMRHAETAGHWATARDGGGNGGSRRCIWMVVVVVVVVVVMLLEQVPPASATVPTMGNDAIGVVDADSTAPAV